VPVNTTGLNCSTPIGTNTFSANVCQIVAGQVPPKPPCEAPPRPLSDCLPLPCSLVNNATARACWGMAPMKNADWAVFVVPVLAMISWPLLIAAIVAVPKEVVSDIAYWSWVASSSLSCWLFALNTWRVVISRGVDTPFLVIEVITWASW
jgi:hypothetical protein